MPSRMPGSHRSRPPNSDGSAGDGGAGTPGGASPTRGLERALPHSEEAERALLGSMLLEKEVIGEAITVLKGMRGEVFFNEHHRLLFDVLLELYDADKLVDDVVLKDELARRGLFEKLGGYDFLMRLASAVPSAMRVRHYGQIVLEKHLLRQLILANHRVMEAAFDDRRPAQELLDYAEKEVFKVTERRVAGAADSISVLIDHVFRQVEVRGDKLITGEPTGFHKLDEMTCGLQPSELIIVAARPSMGKTAIGLNMAEHMAVVETRPVLFFSLEMSKYTLAERILCSMGRVDSQRLRQGRQSQGDLARLQEAASRLAHAPLYVDETSSLSILELRARARMAYRRHKIRAVFVDYLQLMHSPGAESRQVEVAEISRGLKALAKELNIPVIALAQLNRNPEERGPKGGRPRMSDLRESGAIEQDADVVVLLHREAYYKNQGEEESVEEDNSAELIIAKQRNGPTGTVKLHFNRQYTRFDNPSFAAEPGYVGRSYEPDFAPSPALGGQSATPF